MRKFSALIITFRGKRREYSPGREKEKGFPKAERTDPETSGCPLSETSGKTY
jgi:hypothetical protein